MSDGSDSNVPLRGCERQPLDGLGALSLSNGQVELPAARNLEPSSATRWRDSVASVGGVLLAWPLAWALCRPR